METVLTSAALWQDFDPAAEPLDVNVLKTEEFDGIAMKTLYFTGRTVDDGKTRVLAKVAYKSGKSAKPAVLIIDNYKKPVDAEELKFWATNGFVAMAIDFAGRCTKGPSTLYPSSLDYCNCDAAQSYFFVGNSVKNTKIYEYALNCMRAITYLLQEENAKTVSVITVKKGVGVGVIVLGTDKRITNGAVVFGSLYRDFPPYQETDTVLPDEMSEEALQKRLDYEQKSQIWTTGIAPQSYAMQIKVPVYLIVSANSPYVSSEHSNKMYYRLNDDSRMLLLPLAMDYLSDEYAQSLVKWCKGTTVEENVEVVPYADSNGDNFVKVVTTLPHSKIDLWYSRTVGKCRNWVKAPLKKAEDGFVAELDVYQQESNVVAFAFVRGAVPITTALCEVEVKNPGNVQIPTRSLCTCNGDGNLVSVARGSNWHCKKHAVEYCKGYLDIYGAKSTGLATFAVNDPAVRHNDSLAISFDVCCDVSQTLKAFVMTDFGGENVEYTQEVHLVGDGKWQRVTLDGAKFHSADGRQMPEDVNVEMFAVVADEEFLINNIFLV